MKKFLILSLLTLVIPIQVKSHNKPAHDLCQKAIDYKGCIDANSGFSYSEKTNAIGVLAGLECYKRKKGATEEEMDIAVIKSLNDMRINIRIRKDSEVKEAAKKVSYLVDQDDCTSFTKEDQIKMVKVLESLI